jgi:hypothetical protein
MAESRFGEAETAESSLVIPAQAGIQVRREL